MNDGTTPYTGNRANICFDCKRACGGCSWSEVDPVTEKPRFAPVEGWTAKRVKRSMGHGVGHGPVYMETYAITACPMFAEGR